MPVQSDRHGTPGPRSHIVRLVVGMLIQSYEHDTRTKVLFPIFLTSHIAA